MPGQARPAGLNGLDTSALDEINRRLLGELQGDARLTIAELGRRVGLSAPAVAERVQRLEQAGVITGYRAEVDPKAVGYPIAAVVRVRPAAHQLPKIPEVARATPEVVECHRITGEDCFFLKLHLRAMDDLEEILDRFILFGQTTTSIIHSSPVSRRALPLDAGEGIRLAR
jgi:Lrp/AsnC family transcriptional regulator, leucine-responsive regulatory protein